MPSSFWSLVIDVDDTHGDGGAVVYVGDDNVGAGGQVRCAILDYGVNRGFGVG